MRGQETDWLLSHGVSADPGVLRSVDDPKRRSILSIGVTGLASPEERRRIRRAGFDSYLAKPAGADVLVDRIAKL